MPSVIEAAARTVEAKSPCELVEQSGASPRAPSSDHCLSDDTVLALSLGELSPEQGWGRDVHVTDCEQCMQLLTEVVRARFGKRRRRVRAVALEPCVFEPGARVAERYCIRRLLGRGGMGEVYEAIDELRGERIALKTALATVCDDAGSLACLESELRWSRRIKHRNVRRMYELGGHVDPTGVVPFLTMELLDGESLGARLERGPLPLNQACALFRELLLAVSAVHAAGVVHRDVKSENIILTRGAQGRAVLTDFAFATAWSGRPCPSPDPVLVGTPAYMAPELLLGSPQIDAAADVFALAVVLFEMLSGQLPWPRPHERAVWLRSEERMKAPSEIGPTVPRALDVFVLDSLNRDPRRRPSCAAEALSRFELACDVAGVHAAPAGIATFP